MRIIRELFLSRNQSVLGSIVNLHVTSKLLCWVRSAIVL